MFLRALTLLMLLAGCAAVDRGSAPRDASPPPDLDPAPAPADLAAPPTHPAPADLATTVPPPDPTMPDLLPAPDFGLFPPGAQYQISVKSDGQLLSVRNQSTANGTTVEEQPAHGTPDQLWSLQLAANGYRIINAQSTTCLDVGNASTADGALTGIFVCTMGTDQQWSLRSTNDGFYNLVNANSESCLDLDHGYTTPGTQIFQYHCDGGDNQKWLFTRVQ